MSTYVVWIEMDRARVFHIQPGEKRAKILRRREIKHHTSRDPENHKDSEKFFHAVASTIKDANEVLLVGPGLAKRHFEDHLKAHHHTALVRTIAGEKTSHHLSDARLLSLSRKFFRGYDMFGKAAVESG